MAELTPAVAAALESLDAANLDDDWYFTMTVKEEDELQIVQSDPHREPYEKRQLLTVNGIAPDEERQEAFRDKEVERIDAEDPDASGYAYMVDTRTLELVDSGAGYTTLSFVPRIKALEESRDKMRGTVLLNTDSQQIEQIEIINTQPLSPAFSVTVDTYRLTLQFKQEQGANLLNTLESCAMGTAAFVKSFDALVVVSFSDYQRAAP